jgi:hypothetical protein
MHTGFGLALALAFAFAVTNGFHDASNAIATLVATRAARPFQAIVLASGVQPARPAGGWRGGGRHDWRHRHARAGRGGPATGRRRRDPVGRSRRHPSGRRRGYAHRARGLAGARRARRAGRDPRRASGGQAHDAAPAGAGMGGAVGHGGRPRPQPRRQRRAEGGRGYRCVAGRRRAHRPPGAADVDRARLCRGAHRRHGVVARRGLDAQPRPRHDQRVRGHGLRAGCRAGADDRAAFRGRAPHRGGDRPAREQGRRRNEARGRRDQGRAPPRARLPGRDGRAAGDRRPPRGHRAP